MGDYEYWNWNSDQWTGAEDYMPELADDWLVDEYEDMDEYLPMSLAEWAEEQRCILLDDLYADILPFAPYFLSTRNGEWIPF